MFDAYRFPDFQVAGAGPTTVFLLHGAYGSKEYFRYEIETLVKGGLRVVAWDAPGYGISPLPQDGLSIPRMAETFGRLIDQCGTRTNILLGHSMGGVAAPAIRAARPDKVHALVISASLASFSEKSEEDQETFLKERIEPLRHGKSFRETAGAVIDSMFAKGSAGPMVDLVREVALGTNAETFCSAIEAIVKYDGTENIRNVKVPTLLLAGAEDKVGRPKDMESIREKFIPHADFVCIEGAGHYAFAEQHEVFNQHLLSFIRERVPQA